MMRQFSIVALVSVAAIFILAGAARDSGNTSGKENAMRSDEEWKDILTPEQYQILRKKATERPGTGKYLKHDVAGTYTCAGCGNELFASGSKYDSGCGWPAFTEPTETSSVTEVVDRSHGMVRTEILCSQCSGHLGHVFEDGPGPTGLRYCINSGALGFEAEGERGQTDQDEALATFGGGCFWCVEAAFEGLDGVKNVVSGYAGGATENPTYEEVCSKETGHAEVVQVRFDPGVISFRDLLETFFRVHDPTTPDRQGADVGSQYRSIVLYHDAEQKREAEEMVKQLGDEKVFADPIVTEVVALDRFYEAEKYHQDYFARNSEQPYCKMIIAPKLKKLGLKR